MADDFGMGYALGQDSNGGNNGGFGGFGGDGIWAILLFAMIFGYGRNGFGGGYGDGGNGGGHAPWATQADVRAAVDQQTLISKLDQQTYGLADTFTALSNNLNGNFRGLDNAICTLGYQSQQGFSGLSAQMAQCCCDIERGIERNTTQGVMNTNAIQQQISSCCCDLEKMNLQNRFDAERNTCNTLQAIDKLGDRIIGFMTQAERESMRDEITALRLQASQAAQNSYLVNQLRPAPVPAFQVPAPFHYGWGGNGCGCGCGC